MSHVQTTSTPAELSKEELEAYSREAERNCREHMAECETKWKSEGKIFAWFSREPHWAEGALSWFRLKDPNGPCKRIFRFTLIGGGQIKATEKWDWLRSRYSRTEHPDWGKHETWKDDNTVLASFADLTITVIPHTANGVHRYRGLVQSHYSDLSTSAVAFSSNVPQDIADRAAATLRLTSSPDETSFYALLDGSEGCAVCGRALSDEISKLVGVGPDCAHQIGIPHSMQAASKRLELRRKLLGEIGHDD